MVFKRRRTRIHLVYAVAVQILESLRDFCCNVYSLVNERVLINNRFLRLLIYLMMLFVLQNLYIYCVE